MTSTKILTKATIAVGRINENEDDLTSIILRVEDETLSDGSISKEEGTFFEWLFQEAYLNEEIPKVGNIEEPGVYSIIFDGWYDEGGTFGSAGRIAPDHGIEKVKVMNQYFGVDDKGLWAVHPNQI